MVTIVNGSALGLQTSIPGTRSNAGSNVQGQNPDGVFVNSASGNLIIQDQDEVLSSVGSGLSVVRTYNSQGVFDDPSGNNWRLSVEQRVYGLTGTVNSAGSTIIKEFGDGSQITYTYNAGLGLYVAALGTGADDTLSYNSTNSTWTWTNGSTRATEQYNSAGQMTLSADSSNNVTHYAYNGALLTQITDPSGQTTTFEYSGNNLVDIREVSNGATQKRVQYAYDTSNRLTSVAIDLTPVNNSASDPKYITTYTYQGTTDLLASITQSDGTSVSFTYQSINGSYRVATYTDGNGKVTTFGYTQTSSSSATAPANNAVLSTTDTVNQSYSLNTAALSGGSASAISFVQGANTTHNGAFSTVTVPLASAQNAGDLNVVAIGYSDATATVTSVTDSKGNVYTRAGTTLTPGNGVAASLVYYYAKNIVAAAANTNTITVKFSSAVTWPDIRVAEYQGVDPTNPLDGAVGASGTGVSLDSGALTTTNSSDLLVGATYVLNGIAGAGSQYTLRIMSGDEDVLEDRTVSSVGTYNATASQISSGWWMIDLAAFKAASIPAYYTIPSGATWQSIANTLYGVNSAAAGNALQTAMGNPTLTAGAHLTGLPSTLTVPTVTTVAAYYTVPAGATWASIAQAVYGISDAGAVAALQAATGSPSLTTGLHLPVPLTLTYTPSSAASQTQTDITDPLGQTTTYLTDSAGHLTRVLSPTVNGVRLRTDYAYDTGGNLSSVMEDPQGLSRTTTFVYDSNGNLIQTQDADGDTVTRTYDAANQLLTETSYQQPAAGSTAPASPMTKRYVYDTNERLRFVISAIGDVTEYRYNAQGQRTSQLVYGGSDVYSIAGLSTTTVPTLAQMTSWASGLSQTQNQSIDRTDYTYDFRGNLSTATVYSATSTSGVGAGTASTTQYVYDQRGLLLQEIDPRGSATTANSTNPNPNQSYATTYTYDGLGRVQTKTQWVSTVSGTTTTRSSTVIYTDSTDTIQTTAANGLVTTQVYDKAGHLISVSYSGPGSQALGTTTYQYDADGRLAITNSPTGEKQYVIYDAAGRRVGEVDQSADVDGSASLTQYVYDNADGLVKTVRYADYLSAATVATLTDSSGRPVTVSIATLVAALPTTVGRASDQITRSVYDAAGRKVYDIDAVGDVTQYVYDGAGRLTSSVQYAVPVSIAASVDSLTPSQIGVTTTPGSDRRTSYFYDNDGRMVGQLDARGYLTQSIYDAAGELIEKIAYTSPAPTASYSGGQWSNLPSANFAQDEVTAYFYDAEGNLVGSFASVGANPAGTAYSGYFTQTQYDSERNVSSTTQYAQALTYTAGTSTGASLLAAAQAAAAVQGATAPHVTAYSYDGVDQLVQKTDFEGTVTNYVYDAAGHLLSQTVAVGSTIANDTRTTQFQYDALGRVKAQLSAAGSALLTGNLTQAQINAIWAEYGTSYTYDAAGRRTSQTVTAYNPTTGTTQTETTQYFYNEAGQLRFTLNALGEVTENQYNALGQLSAQISYYNRVSNPSALVGGLLTSSALSVFGAIASAVNAAHSVKDKKTTYTYTLAGKLASQTTVEGANVTYTYDAFGEEKSSSTVVDATQGINLIRNFTYDLDGDLSTAQSDPSGANQVLTYAYDAFGRQTSVTDQYGNKTSTQYDSLGRVIATIDAVTNVANGSTGTATSTKTTYDAFARVLTSVDALGNTTQYRYDDVSRSVTLTSPEGVTLTTVHNRNGQTLTVTSATNTTTYSYNLDGQVTSISDTISGASTPLESRQYDSAGREVSQTDANGIVTSFSYDAANRVLTRTVDPTGLNLSTTYVYDGEGRTMTTTNSNGVVTTTQYDADGRVTQVTLDPSHLNIVTQYQYNNEGDVITLTQGANSNNPRVTQYTYDALGRRKTELVDPGTGNNPHTGQPYLNILTQYFYDANGNLTEKIDGNGNPTWYSYDADNRLQYTLNALGGITETDYDANGRVSATRQYAAAQTPPASTVRQVNVTPGSGPNDRLTRHYYDRDGNEVYTIDAAGTVTQRTYDSNGDVIQLRVISGTSLTGTYATTAAVTTALGTAATTLGSNDRVQWTAYDARGRAILSVDALGYVTQNQYDGDGNVVSSTAYYTAITPPSALVTSISSSVSASGVPQIVFNGNSAGQITVVTDSANDRQTRYWYDAAGREVFTLNAAGYLTQTLYNDAAHTKTVTEYATKQTLPANATTSQLLTVGTIATNAGTSTLIDPTGQVVIGADQTTTTVFDAAGRVSQVTDALGHSESYVYDALGNKTSYTNKNQQTWTYEYDAGGRLIEEDSPYVSVTNVTASGSALTATAVNASIVRLMQYDGLGNVLTLQEGIEAFSNGTKNTANSRTTTYGYDALGRQTSVQLSSVPVYNGIGSDTVVVSESGTAIGSNSTLKSVSTEVKYDTLGNEIASRDAGNNWTYKVYDQLGRVVYQIDALNFITGYAYDAFGNQTATTRYNTALATTATGGTPATISGSTLSDLLVTSTSSSGAQIKVVNGNSTSSVYVVAGSQDRTINTSYDRDNRVSQVIQPQVFAYNLATDESGQQLPSFTTTPTIQYTHDAFGQVVRTATLINSTGPTKSWAYSFSYYDKAGNKTADVDADGYLTTYQYDAQGNLTGQMEYGARLSVSGGNPPTPVGSSDPTDRQTQYLYDGLNRKVEEIRVGVADGTGTSTANAPTYYGYDALGNQTSVSSNGGVTYTYYDVLGRVIASVGPAPNGGSNVTPLTLMQRDVYGNLVAQTQYAAGLISESGTAAPTTANTSPDANKDRTTFYLRDVEGHALETEQFLTSANSGEGNAIGNIYTFDAYDERGNLVKQYQPANATDTLATFYTYDALGQETDVISPELVGSSSQVADNFTHYNAFGEVVGKGVVAYGGNKTDSEVYYYDADGRVFLSNANGAYEAYLYDLAGNLTGKFQEQTANASAYNLFNHLSSGSSAKTAYDDYVGNNNDGLLFTQTQYDAMGHIVGTILPTFSVANPIEAMTNTGVQVQTFGSTRYLTWYAPADSTLTPVLYIDGVQQSFSHVPNSDGTGNEYGYQAEYALTGLSLGPHSYVIKYIRPTLDINGQPIVAGETTGTFSVGESLAPIVSANPGTVTSVSAVLSGTTLFVSWTPDNSSVLPKFSILVNGTWQDYTGTIGESGIAGVSLTAPAAGTYQYRITDTLTGATEAQGTGTITITAPTTTTSLGVSAGTTGTVASISASVSGSNTTVSWQADGNVTSSTFQILIGGNWTSYTATVSESGLCSVTFALPAAATYQYRIVDQVQGMTEAQATGSISFTAAVTTISLNNNTVATEGTVSGVSTSVSGSTASVSWTADAGTTGVFSILIGGTWTNYTPTQSESGVFTVSFAMPAAGTYQYRIADLVSSNEPEAQGTGSISFTAAGTSATLANNTVATEGTINSVSSLVSGSSAYVLWTPDIAGTTGVFSILVGGSWSNYTPTVTESGQYQVIFPKPAAGTYQYRIADLVSGSDTEAQGTGTITISTSSSSISAPTQVSAVTGFTNLGNGVLGWSTAANSGDTVVFRYKAFAASSWAGTLPVSGSSPSYSANLSGLSGNIEYEVDYIASGATFPYKVGHGAITVGSTPTPASSSISAPTQLSAVTGFASLGNGVLGWNTAANSGDAVVFRYKAFGASSWAGTLPVSGSSPSYSVNLSGLSGSIEYEVDYTASGAAWPYKVGHGAVTVQTNITPASGSVGTPTELLAVSGVTDLGNGVLGWNTAANSGDTLVFHYKSAGAASWAGTLAISGSGPSYSVDMSGLSGVISYEIDYIAAGASQPYRVGWGGVTINRSTNPGVASASAPVNLLAISGFQDLGNGVLSWTTAANSGDTIVFHYKNAGATAWAGTVPVSGTGPYSVDLSALSGTLAYEIDYTAAGAAQPYRAETGTITINTGLISAVQDTTLSSLPSTTVTPTESQTVDRWGNVLSWTNTDHRTVDYTYNSYNELLTTTDPYVTAVAVTMQSNNTSGLISTTASARPTSYNYYDRFGRLIETQDANGNITTQSYNAANQLISQQDADGGHKSYFYDAFGDQIQITTAVTQGTSYQTLNAYDQAGRLTDTEQELVANTLTSANATGFSSNLLPASNANVIRTQYQYDQAGRRVAVVDGAGQITRTTYDLHGNVSSTTTALGTGHTTSYGYDLQDRKTSETDANGNQQSWTYDYFGRLTSHTDLGGTLSSYTYDTAGSGLLTRITSTGGHFAPVNQTYSYDTANHLTGINDTGVNSQTYYYYDGAGRIERQQTTDGALLAEDTSTQYDAQGRIANISGLGYSIDYAYDAAGNRTNIDAFYTTRTGVVSEQNYWYGYDSMNRVLLSEAARSGSSVAISDAQGTILTYDWQGDRTSATTFATNFPTEFLTTESGSTYATFGTSTGRAYYTYAYDGAGRLTDTYVQPASNLSAAAPDIDSRVYDKASRITQESTLSVTKGVTGYADNTPLFDIQTNTYNADGTLLNARTTQNGHLASLVSYAHLTNESGQVTNGYDAAGNLIGFQVSNYDPTVYDANNNTKLLYTSQDTFTYVAGNSYLEASQSVFNTAAQGTAPGNGSTLYTYNADQQLIQYVDTQKMGNNRAFLDNANGQVLTVALGTDGGFGATGSASTTYGSDANTQAQFARALTVGNAFFQSNNAQYFFYDAHGNSVGTFGQLNNNLTANFDVNFTPISQQYPADVPPQYVVQSGDTLAAIAARIYGDASLWYIIAEANGLTDEGPNGSPGIGTSLTLPNVVVALPNSAQSFKPFSISQALGDTTPYQPPPPPQSGGGCGVLGTILAAVVTAIGIALQWYPVVTAVAAAVADAAGQEADIALGNQQSFSWTQVVEAGVGAGIGAEFAVAAPTLGISIPAVRVAAYAAIADTASQTVAISLGDQKGFNWAEVAVAAAIAPVAQAVGGKVGGWVGQGLGGSVAAQTFGRYVGALAAGELSSVAISEFSGGKVSQTLVVVDAFANVIGNSHVQAVAGPPAAGNQSNSNSGEQAQAYGADNPTAVAVANADGSTTNAQNAPLTKNPVPESAGSAGSNDSSMEEVLVQADRIRARADTSLDLLASAASLNQSRPGNSLRDGATSNLADLANVAYSLRKQGIPIDRPLREAIAESYSDATGIPGSGGVALWALDGEADNDQSIIQAQREQIKAAIAANDASLLKTFGPAPLIVGSVNLGVKAASGIAGALTWLGTLGDNDTAASVVDAVKTLQIDMSSPLSNAIGNTVRPYYNQFQSGLESTVGAGGAAYLNGVVEFAGDVAAFDGFASPSRFAGQSLRSTAAMSEFADLAPGAAAARAVDGQWVAGLQPRSNLEVYGAAVTRTEADIPSIMAKVGLTEDDLAGYQFRVLTPEQYSARVSTMGAHFDASYGPAQISLNSEYRFMGDVASTTINGDVRIPIYLNPDIMGSDEAIVQAVSHEWSEVEALRYAAAQPISGVAYSKLVTPYTGMSTPNLHFRAVNFGDQMLTQFRSLLPGD